MKISWNWFHKLFFSSTTYIPWFFFSVKSNFSIFFFPMMNIMIMMIVMFLLGQTLRLWREFSGCGEEIFFNLFVEIGRCYILVSVFSFPQILIPRLLFIVDSCYTKICIELRRTLDLAYSSLKKVVWRFHEFFFGLYWMHTHTLLVGFSKDRQVLLGFHGKIFKIIVK